ncbi:MAG TPA: YbaB/EbfC family nucleoid-associated protein, partial [Pseudonocardia sp.]|nr:YbaB/EbfC family nucleoid-associated protein [Pseudonocardia sp.]
MNGEEWLAGYRDRLTDLRARTARAQDALARAEATVTSPDGAVTVTVGPTGALRGLVLAERTAGLSRTQLAAAVLATARTAQDRAAREAVDAAAPLL